jgi:hypothetical protein
MKSNKKFLAVAVAGALTVAAAVPALALENEFHGTFTSYYDLSNLSAAGNDGSGSNADGLKKAAPTENYFVQRVRLGYNAKASDNVKLVTNFEFDYKFLGNSSYTVGRNTGGGLGADSVNMETKSLYLELSYPVVNAKIGMQPYNDSFKGIVFDADMAGVLLSHEYSNASVAAGFFRFSDKGGTLGRNTNDMISLDAKYNITKEFKVGAAYYYINDNRTNGKTTTVRTGALPSGYTADGAPIFDPTDVTITANPNNDVKVHTLGLNAESAVGPVTLNGFALAQFGDLSETQKAKGYAFNIGAKMNLFGGTARSEFLYVAGGKNSMFLPSSPIGSEGGGFYDSEMIMLHRDKNSKTIDTAIVYDVNNFNQGVITGSLGYDYPFSDKLSGSVNAGFAAVAKNNGTVAGTSDYLGTEVNAETNYKLTANVNLTARAGYVFLGDYFKGLNADNPYDLKIIAKYSF